MSLSWQSKGVEDSEIFAGSGSNFTCNLHSSGTPMGEGGQCGQKDLLNLMYKAASIAVSKMLYFLEGKFSCFKANSRDTIQSS